MKRAYADIPEGQIHYQFAGSGQPLLLLHQTAFSSVEYSQVMPILANHFHVVAMDTIGYGMSDPAPYVFEIADYARTVKEFMTALGIAPAHIVGHHTGSSIGLELATAYPDLVKKLVLSGCPYYEASERKERMTKFRPLQITTDGSYILDKWRLFQQYMPNAGPENWHEFIITQLRAGPRGEDGHYAVFRYDEKERLSKLTCPTLLIYGSKDTFISRLEPTQALVPHSQTKVIEGADALIALEKPEEFARSILDFLK